MKKILLVVGVVGAAAALLLSSCKKSKDGDKMAKRYDGTKIVLTVNDPFCTKTACGCVAEDAVRSYDGLVKYIKEKTGIELEFIFQEEMQLLDRDIKTKKADGMICKCWDALQLAQKYDRDMVRVADITRPIRKQGLWGCFVVKKDSPIKTLKDIKGKKVIFGSIHGYEKHFMAIKTLKDNGIPVPAEKDMVTSPTCQNCIVDLMENKGDVAVVSDYAMQYSCVKDFADPNDFRIVSYTEAGVPFVTLMLDKKVNEGARHALQKALLEISGKNVPKEYFTKGWIKPVKWNPKELKSMKPKS